jgi:hypothetical protein
MTQAIVHRYRWTICGLLFFATTVNYLDRQVLSLLAPDAVQGVRLVQHRLRQHHRGVPVRLRDLDAVRRPRGRPHRHQARVHRWPSWSGRSARCCMPGAPMGATAAKLFAALGWPRAGVGGRLHGGARRAGDRRSGQLPGRDQGHRRILPEEGALLRHRHLQFRRQRRRDPGADHRAVDRRNWGWQTAFVIDRRDRFPVDGLWTYYDLPGAAEAPGQGRAGLHQQRLRRRRAGVPDSERKSSGCACSATARPGPSRPANS